MLTLSRRGFLSACLSLVALVAFVSVASARPITGVVAFGDSLSDTGNASALAALLGQTFPQAPYAPGRLSNGALWVEQLGSSLGVPVDSKAFAGAYTDTRNVGGAFVPGIATQVGGYLSANPAVNPNNLYTVFGGANDIFQLLAGNSATLPDESAQNIANRVSALIGAGATELLVPNLPNLGAVPGVVAGGNVAITAATGSTLLFNSTLAALLNNISLANPTVNIRQVDIFTTFTGLAPGVGGLTNTTQNYITSVGGTQGVNPTISAAGLAAGSPTGFLFWDEVHPTTLGHSFIAQSALATVVPEPGTFALLAVGASLLCGVVVRRR